MGGRRGRRGLETLGTATANVQGWQEGVANFRLYARFWGHLGRLFSCLRSFLFRKDPNDPSDPSNRMDRQGLGSDGLDRWVP